MKKKYYCVLLRFILVERKILPIYPCPHHIHNSSIIFSSTDTCIIKKKKVRYIFTCKRNIAQLTFFSSEKTIQHIKIILIYLLPSHWLLLFFLYDERIDCLAVRVLNLYIFNTQSLGRPRHKSSQSFNY